MYMFSVHTLLIMHTLFCVHSSDKENADPNGAGKGNKTTSRGKRQAPLVEDSGTNQQTKTADKLKAR